MSKIDHWKYQWFPWCISIVCVIFEGFNVTLTQPFCHSILLSKLQIHWVIYANFFLFTHILNRLDVRIHLEASKIYHTYTKNWVNRDWVICFFWRFLVISELGSRIYIVKSAILIFWVFLPIFLHEITLQAIDIDNIGCLEPFLPLWEHFWNRVSVQLNCASDLTLRHIGVIII